MMTDAWVRSGAVPDAEAAIRIEGLIVKRPGPWEHRETSPTRASTTAREAGPGN